MLSKARRAMAVTACTISLLVPAFGWTDAGATPVTSALSDRGALVTAVYNDFLGRNPAASELTWWVSRLGSGTPVASLVNSAAASNAWVNHIVTRFYEDTLGRAPDAAGLAYWDGTITSGSKTVAQVASQFYASNEYFNGIGGGSTSSWVSDLYKKLLGRVADARGLAYWTGQANAVGRATVAFEFYQSDESCRARVTLLYQQILQRSPDQAGLEYWAGVVRMQGDLALSRFLAESSEYAAKSVARFASGSPFTMLETPAGFTTVQAYATSSGAVYGTVSANAVPVPAYWPTPTSRPVLMPIPSGFQWAAWAGVTPSGQVVVNLTNLTTGGAQPFVWNSPSANPIPMSLPNGVSRSLAFGVNATGVVFGSAPGIGGIDQPIVWPTPTSKPVSLVLPAGDQGGTTLGSTNTGAIFGQGYAGNARQALVWASPSVQPTILKTPTGLTSVRLSGSTSSGSFFGSAVNASSKPVGLVWSSAAAQATVLLSPSGSIANYSLTVNGGTSAGAFFGSADGPSGEVSIIWPSASSQPHVLAPPTGFDSVSVVGSNSAGYVGTASGNNARAAWLTWTSTPSQPSTLYTAIDGAVVTSARQVLPKSTLVELTTANGTYLASS